MNREHIHFVTGRLAEASLRDRVERLASALGFDYTIDVLPITVAALMTPKWIADRITAPPQSTRVIITGYCQGDLAPILETTGITVERGPRDLRQLSEYLGLSTSGKSAPDDERYGGYDIEILAEINHAPGMALAEIVAEAQRLRHDGADLIDLGCNPGETWNDVGQAVRALRDEGHRVSIDSLNVDEIAAAVAAGTELVLSVNETNREAAADWGCEVVVIPDAPGTLEGMDETIALLEGHNVSMRLDPILEPIGFGFANSLQRYMEVRCQFPDAEMMMGIGNLTELTDADSAGINVLLLGICQELGVRSVLTTQVIHWARCSVQECDLARRLVYYAVNERMLPKHVEPRLVMLRGGEPLVHGHAALAKLAEQIKDNNYRIFAEEGQLHVINGSVHLSGPDAFELFDQLTQSGASNLDTAHAFYLGYEMAKATTALTLGKDYRQDEALDWGMATRPEASHRLKTARKNRKPAETDVSKNAKDQ